MIDKECKVCKSSSVRGGDSLHEVVFFVHAADPGADVDLEVWGSDLDRVDHVSQVLPEGGICPFGGEASVRVQVHRVGDLSVQFQFQAPIIGERRLGHFK